MLGFGMTRCRRSDGSRSRASLCSVVSYVLPVLGLALLFAGCGPEALPAVPTPEESNAAPSPTTGDGGARQPDATPTLPAVSVSSPMVSTAVAFDTSPPLRDITPVLPGGGGPPLTPDASGKVTYRWEDVGRGVEMKVGDRLELAPNDGYEWQVKIGDGSILSVESKPNGAGAWVFKAVSAGQTTLSVTGELPCHRAIPPCGAPTLSMEVQVTVR